MVEPPSSRCFAFLGVRSFRLHTQKNVAGFFWSSRLAAETTTAGAGKDALPKRCYKCSDVTDERQTHRQTEQVSASGVFYNNIVSHCLDVKRRCSQMKPTATSAILSQGSVHNCHGIV